MGNAKSDTNTLFMPFMEIPATDCDVSSADNISRLISSKKLKLSPMTEMSFVTNDMFTDVSSDPNTFVLSFVTDKHVLDTCQKCTEKKCECRSDSDPETITFLSKFSGRVNLYQEKDIMPMERLPHSNEKQDALMNKVLKTLNTGMTGGKKNKKKGNYNPDVSHNKEDVSSYTLNTEDMIRALEKDDGFDNVNGVVHANARESFDEIDSNMSELSSGKLIKHFDYLKLEKNKKHGVITGQLGG